MNDDVVVCANKKLFGARNFYIFFFTFRLLFVGLTLNFSPESGTYNTVYNVHTVCYVH